MNIIRLFGKIFIIALLFFIIALLFMQQKPFGKLPSGSSLEKIKKSQFYKKDRFENIQRTPMLGNGSSYWSVYWKVFC